MASAKGAAAHIFCSRAVFAKMVQAGVISRPPKRGEYDLDQVRREYIIHIRETKMKEIVARGIDKFDAAVRECERISDGFRVASREVLLQVNAVAASGDDEVRH